MGSHCFTQNNATPRARQSPLVPCRLDTTHERLMCGPPQLLPSHCCSHCKAAWQEASELVAHALELVGTLGQGAQTASVKAEER